MRFPDDMQMYARFACGLRGFPRETITLEEAKAIVRRRLEQREESFLQLVKKGIYSLLIPSGLLVVSFSPLLLSTLTQMLHDNQVEAARSMIQQTVRLGLCLLPFVAAVAGSASHIVDLVQSRRYWPSIGCAALARLWRPSSELFSRPSSPTVFPVPGRARAVGLSSS